MNAKETLIRLKDSFNENKPPLSNGHKINLFFGLKPSLYFAPPSPLKQIDAEPDISYFVEVFVEEQVVFRQYQGIHQGTSKEDMDAMAERLSEKILLSLFSYGVMSSKSFLDKHSAAITT